MSSLSLNAEVSKIPVHAPPKHGGQAHTGKTKRSILVVDDEKLIADTVVRILNVNGFVANAAYSGKEAIDLVHKHCPDLVLSDVLMPHMDGVEAAIAITGECPDTRIILFSGHAATADILARAAKKGHHFELLTKPIHPAELIKHLSA